MKYIGKLKGYSVFTDENMQEPIRTEVKRKFFERLFSMNPFKSTKTVITYVPFKNAVFGNNKIIIHPNLKYILLELIQESKDNNETNYNG